MTLPPFHIHADTLLVALGLEGAYLWAVARSGPRHVAPGERPASRWQVASFTSAVAALLVATSWPVHDLAERYLFSIHMVQHTIISLVVPPLLLLGMPAWLLRVVLRSPALAWAVRRLARPFVALVLFNLVIVVTHWPLVVDLTLRHHLAHLAAHVILFGSATLMWWPAISPLPEMPGLSYPGRMLYLFLQSVVPTVPASFLTFGSAPFYPFYVAAPRIWGISALTDQLVAGLIMKLAGGFILWTGIAVIFFKWFTVEQTEGWDELAVGKVDREIRAELTKR